MQLDFSPFLVWENGTESSLKKSNSLWIDTIYTNCNRTIAVSYFSTKID